MFDACTWLRRRHSILEHLSSDVLTTSLPRAQTYFKAAPLMQMKTHGVVERVSKLDDDAQWQ